MDYEKEIYNLLSSYDAWWDKGFETPKMENKLYPYNSIFTPIKINNCVVKNRIVMAPMGNIDMAEETGRPNQMMLKYFEARARGGVGLITTGLVPVSYGIDKSLIELGDLTYFPRIDRSRTVYPGWRDLAMLCHSHDAKIFVQLTPGLGRVGNPQCLITQHSFPRSASFNPNWYMSAVPCLRLSDRSLKKIIKKIGQASADAKACNLDGVYLHGHEGYLLEQVSNSAFNHRKLGRYANKENFACDMVKEIRKRVGPDYPIMYRIDLTLALNATYKDKMRKVKPLKRFKKERQVHETLRFMEHLVKCGVDIFDVDMGCYDNWFLPHPPMSMPSGCFLELSKLVKDYFKEKGIRSNKGLEVPIVAVGKLGYPDLAESALREEKCDMVMLGRPLLADPDWVNKAFKGDTMSIRPCIGCQEGCLNEFVEGGHPQCAVNPLTAFEYEFPNEVTKAEVKKNCLVVGSGPGGVMMAKTLLRRGHTVTLVEKEDHLGGQVNEASIARIKYEMKNYLYYLEHEVNEMKKNSNFTLILNKEVKAEEVKDKYDVIVCATGAKECKINIPGIDNENVFFAQEILKNPAKLKDFNEIVVAGGGMVGCETAYFLRYELNKNVSVIEMDKYFMNHMCTANRSHLIHYLDEGKVKLFNMTKLLEIKKDSIVVDVNVSKNKPNPYVCWAPILPENIENPMDKLKPIKDVWKREEIKADAIVLALGSKSETSLYDELVKTQAAKEIYRVGDAIKPARVWEATRSAFRKGAKI